MLHTRGVNMEKVNFQNRMIYGVKKLQSVVGKTITLEYVKAGSTTKIQKTLTGTFEKFSDEAIREQTTYSKDSMIFKILCSDLLTTLGTIKVKNLNSTIFVNNIKYNVVTEELSSDEVLLKLYLNTV